MEPSQCVKLIQAIKKAKKKFNEEITDIKIQ